VVRVGRLMEDPPTERVAPIRVALAFGRHSRHAGAGDGPIRRPGRLGWNAHDPVVPRSGRAEFDLSGVAGGGHEIELQGTGPDVTSRRRR
jgi:hypothetical protein